MKFSFVCLLARSSSFGLDSKWSLPSYIRIQTKSPTARERGRFPHRRPNKGSEPKLFLLISPLGNLPPEKLQTGHGTRPNQGSDKGGFVKSINSLPPQRLRYPMIRTRVQSFCSAGFSFAPDSWFFAKGASSIGMVGHATKKPRKSLGEAILCIGFCSRLGGLLGVE